MTVRDSHVYLTYAQDTAGLSADPETFARYRTIEVIHARYDEDLSILFAACLLPAMNCRGQIHSI